VSHMGMGSRVKRGRGAGRDGSDGSDVGGEEEEEEEAGGAGLSRKKGRSDTLDKLSIAEQEALVLQMLGKGK